ncbi:hypothetical protein [Comamonas sp. NLF-1-9]|uniref:hypothetical protein n=1 Tax=Comamonas sp. NLF-1-9 TaxID=2853163 RepID=UPI001C48578B|nr:hypothetical protein [Comamonas sp. NLF-1-9]QXL84124.1 hypothetical protein KUD94_12925 [Comamonas sp. NLF-1-9]
MSTLMNIAIGLVIAVMLALGFDATREHWREQGREEVRAECLRADQARDALATRDALARAQEQRAKEQRMSEEAEKNALEATKREAVLRDRLAAIVRSHDGLQRELARRDAASSDRRAAGTCAAADAEADEAATARGLLGACAGRYRSMAAGAASLAEQVMGLQAHVLVVQPQAAALVTPEIEEAR